MNSNDILTYSIIGLVVWGVILSFIISGATRSKSIELRLKIQTLLLAKMAQRQGVPDTEVADIINIKQ